MKLKENLIIAKLNYEVRLHERKIKERKIRCHKINKEKSTKKQEKFHMEKSIFYFYEGKNSTKAH